MFQGMQEASRSWRSREMDSAWSPRKGAQLCWHLDCGPGRPTPQDDRQVLLCAAASVAVRRGSDGKPRPHPPPGWTQKPSFSAPLRTRHLCHQPWAAFPPPVPTPSPICPLSPGEPWPGDPLSPPASTHPQWALGQVGHPHFWVWTHSRRSDVPGPWHPHCPCSCLWTQWPPLRPLQSSPGQGFLQHGPGSSRAAGECQPGGSVPRVGMGLGSGGWNNRPLVNSRGAAPE